ncbi:[protein-PII] uridylyltransferase [Tepidicaulis sp. LMO-SS28]|uniref:[protein-PII] uridylyltransferase n=1 Tax=Tepidicaulis sp. LMO-SS28 TaxID=3447455 RepID=UPI003EDEA3CC
MSPTLSAKAAPAAKAVPAETRPSRLDVSDPERLLADLAAIADEGGDEMKSRQAVVDRLRKELKEGRALCRERLEDGTYKGRTCAVTLSYLMDSVITSLYSFATAHAFQVANPSDAEKLAVVAVGGYGRGTMAPGSDVDLLFLLPYKQTPWGESLVEYMLYILWDLGLKVGHATRSVDECVRLSKSDMTIRTSILEARFLTGAEELFGELEERFFKDVATGTATEFVEAKLEEQDERHVRSGRSRYLVEPNVKDGKGGQRDIHTMFWIAKYVYHVKKPQDLAKVGLFTRREFNTLTRADDFLWAVRCMLHFLTGRAEERITFDLQPELSRLLGYQGHRGLKGVERFMKHYFLVAKDVGDLTRILCTALEEQEQKKKPGIGRFMQALRRKKDIKGFTLDRGRLSVVSDTFFEKDPVNLIRLFHVAQEHGLYIHPDALKLVTRSLKLINKELRANEEANRLFLEILSSRKDPERTLRKMNEVGLLGKFVPDFGRIVALMQFNMYHHYTADEHLLRAIGILAEIESGELAEEHPLATELFQKINNRNILYVAMFLHDIAKGRPEDHSEAGAKIAKKLCPRLGMSPSETETVAWLVQYHLVMSDVAQKRDLSDPKTIRDFVAHVQSPERLKLLEILTEADIRAVGPGTWNGWKSQLLRQLYYEADSVLGGQAHINRKARIEDAKAALEEALADWPKTRREKYLRRHPDAYWLSFDTPTHIRHAQMIYEASDDGLTVVARPDPMSEATEITLYAQDHPGLFSRVAGACSAAGTEILEAKIFTTRDGMAFDTLWVHDVEMGAISEPRRLKALENTFRKVLLGEIMAPDAIENRYRRQKRVEAFTIEPQVYVDNQGSDEFTLIEVNGLDRPGLLHALTRTIFHLGLSIGSAQIATFGERAVDVFYVKDLVGHKVTNGNKIKAIQRHLLEALDDPMKKARPQTQKEPGKEKAKQGAA